MTAVRIERPADQHAVRRVNEAAFGRPDEADIVDRLRMGSPDYLGLVAVEGEAVRGHIAFTPVTFEPARPGSTAYGLAPMAVLPEHQRSGVGGALVRAGLDACRGRGAGGVVVLGHPAYYPRFGFRPASAFGLRCAYDVPDEAFMALALRPSALDGPAGTVAGTVHYHPALAG